MITFTELAAHKVLQHIERRGQGIGIRIGVKQTGCSGLAYVLEYIDTAPVTRDWFKYESHGATVWVNGKDSIYLDGLEIDYKKQGLNEGFDFNNPQAKDYCGCGESFRVHDNSKIRLQATEPNHS
jgi:iron-sulfur cluster assembly protein